MPLAHDGSLPDTRAQRRCAARYLIQSDITNFYPSIYTHSVPWAIETKPISKARFIAKGAHLYADKLDEYLRNCQEGQTLGVPIGPDTSLVIAELLLSEIDRRLQSDAPPVAGLRYYDDYELSYRTHAEAEQGLATLQSILADFQLDLSRTKTRIVETIQPLDRLWVNKIRSFTIPQKNARRQRVAILSYFDAMNELSAEHPDDNVIEYAVGRVWRQVANRELADYNSILIQNLMLQVLLARSSASVECYHVFLLLEQQGLKLDLDSLTANTNAIIEDHARLGHGSEVAWAVWASMRFNLTISIEAAKALASSSDDIVALLALDADTKGLVAGGLDRTKWEPLMADSELLGEHWLLAYEAKVKNWLPSVAGVDHVIANQWFRHLKNANVSFYDASPSKLAAYVPPQPKVGSS